MDVDLIHIETSDGVRLDAEVSAAQENVATVKTTRKTRISPAS